MEFGTGVMTITPWHDMTDFEIAKRHNLEFEQIIDFEGNLMEIAGDFKGMNIFEARPKLIESLKQKGLVTKIDDNYEHALSVNYRGKGIIEPQIMKQWFIDVNKKALDWKGQKSSLKEVMIDVVKTDMVKIIPDRFNHTYFQWIDNLRDWCISRQIWWGHQIPVWYKVSDIDMQKIQAHGEIASSYEFQSLNIDILDMRCQVECPVKTRIIAYQRMKIGYVTQTVLIHGLVLDL